MVTVPAVVALVAVPALPRMLPTIGLVTVKLAKVPTEVNEEFNTLAARVAPVKLLDAATAVMVISPEPSKAVPLMLTGVANFVAVPALPVTLPVIGAVTVKPLKVPTDVIVG